MVTITKRRACYSLLAIGAVTGAVWFYAIDFLEYYHGAAVGLCVGYIVFEFGGGLLEAVKLLSGFVGWLLQLGRSRADTDRQ